MKITSKLAIIMVILSFGFLTAVSVSQADWWDRGGRPVLPRDDGFVLPTTVPTVKPETPPGNPSVTPPRTGGPQPTNVPGSGSGSNDDPCASGQSYTGDYCGWSPRIGGDGGSSSDPGDLQDPGVSGILGLSETAGYEVGLSDIMLLSGILCLLLYAKSKFAPNINVRLQGKRKSH